MSILKGHPGDTIERRPYDEQGRFVSVKCELCGTGTLRYQGNRFWSCDGLLDPNDPDKELEACPAYHYDGEAVHQIKQPAGRGSTAPSGVASGSEASAEGATGGLK